MVRFSSEACHARHFFINWALAGIFAILAAAAGWVSSPLSPFERIDNKLDRISIGLTRVEIKLETKQDKQDKDNWRVASDGKPQPLPSN